MALDVSIFDRLGGVSEKNREAFEKYMATATTIPYTPDMALGTVVNKRATAPMEPLQLIIARLRLPLAQGQLMKLPNINDIHVYVQGTDTAIVFLVNKDNKPIIIEDDPSLFPSDALITQLRLIMG